jgi:LPS sulfotransferase NodH
VLLSRRNKLRQAISYYRAIRTDAWSSLHHAVNSIETSTIALDEIERLRVELDCADLSWRASFRSVGTSPLRLWYEDLAEQPEAAVHAVLRQLGINDDTAKPLPPPRLQQQADAVTEEIVAAYLRWTAAGEGIDVMASGGAAGGCG